MSCVHFFRTLNTVLNWPEVSIALISVHAYQVNVFFSHSYIFRKVTFGCLCKMGGGEGRVKERRGRRVTDCKIFFLAEVNKATGSVGLAFSLDKSAVIKDLFLSPLIGARNVCNYFLYFNKYTLNFFSLLYVFIWCDSISGCQKLK